MNTSPRTYQHLVRRMVIDLIHPDLGKEPQRKIKVVEQKGGMNIEDLGENHPEGGNYE